MTLSLWLLPKVPQSARGSRIYATSHSVMNRRGLRLANFYDPIELSDSSTLCLAIGNLSWAGIWTSSGRGGGPARTNPALLSPLPGQRGSAAPRGHHRQSRQSPAPARPAAGHSELIVDELAAVAVQDRWPPRPICPILRPATRRTLLSRFR